MQPMNAEVDAILLSVKVASCVALAVLPPSVLAGWVLARKQFRGKVILESLIHAPLVIPPVVTGYLLLMFCGRRGPLGQWLDQTFGIQLAFSWQGAVLAAGIVALPLAVRSARVSISHVDWRLEEAASSLGYGPLRRFFMITLPLAWPGILSGMLLAFSRSLGEFGATITFAGNIEGVTQTLPLAIHSALQVPGGDSSAMRLVLCSLALCFLSVFLSERVMRIGKPRWAHETGY